MSETFKKMKRKVMLDGVKYLTSLWTHSDTVVFDDNKTLTEKIKDIGTVNNGTLSLKNGTTTVKKFTANSANNVSVDIGKWGDYTIKVGNYPSGGDDPFTIYFNVDGGTPLVSTDIYNNGSWKEGYTASFGADNGTFLDGIVGNYNEANPLLLEGRAQCVINQKLRGTVTIKYTYADDVKGNSEAGIAYYPSKPSTVWDNWDFSNRTELCQHTQTSEGEHTLTAVVDGYLRIEADASQHITVESITIK